MAVDKNVLKRLYMVDFKSILDIAVILRMSNADNIRGDRCMCL